MRKWLLILLLATLTLGLLQQANAEMEKFVDVILRDCGRTIQEIAKQIEAEQMGRVEIRDDGSVYLFGPVADQQLFPEYCFGKRRPK